MSKVAAYLEKGKTYLVVELDEALREIGSEIVSRDDLPKKIADECDGFEPHEHREVKLPESVSHPKARDAALMVFSHWSKLDVTKEEAFDHAIAEYLTARQITPTK
jgi:hypothetical protein